MTAIYAGTTSTTAYGVLGDTSGNLVLQTNGTTPALTLTYAQNAILAGTLNVNGNIVTVSNVVGQNATIAGTLNVNGNIIAANVGIGATLNGWASVTPALQIGATGVLTAHNTNNYVNLGTNYYYNGSINAYSSNNTATLYSQNTGNHYWYTATTGTTGSSVPFTMAMSISNAGAKTVPNQPYFAVYTMNAGTLTSSPNTLRGTAAIYDNVSGWNSSTGRYTCQVAGRYVFGCAVLVQTGSGRCENNMAVNGGSTQVVNLNGTGTTYDGPDAQAVFTLNVGDYVSVNYGSGTPYASAHPSSYFWGYMLG